MERDGFLCNSEAEQASNPVPRFAKSLENFNRTIQRIGLGGSYDSHRTHEVKTARWTECYVGNDLSCTLYCMYYVVENDKTHPQKTRTNKAEWYVYTT